jgi:hypothetical protein
MDETNSALRIFGPNKISHGEIISKYGSGGATGTSRALFLLI